MSIIYYAGPVTSDSQYAQKRAILTTVANSHDLKVYFPLDTVELKSVAVILDEMRRASVLIVDLSLQRPSVYFELGLAAAINRPFVLIAEAGTVMHQIPHPHILNHYSNLQSYGILLETILSSQSE